MSNNTRIFSGTDARMIETAYTLHSLFNDHIAEFTLLDTQLDAAFATAWYAKIDAASTIHRDSQIKDIQAQLTEEVLVQMELCRKKYMEVKYFADKAFPNNHTKMNEFGVETYGDIRIRQDNMVNFIDEMNHSCLKYSTQLLAAGMTQVQIDDVQTRRDNLLAANTEQENYMRARPNLTKTRIDTLNECYQQTIKVVEAAMLVYYNDETSKKMFVFYKGNSSSSNNGGSTDDSPNQDTVNLTIPADDTPQLVYSIAYEPTREYIIVNNGPAEVEFYIANDLNGMGSPVMFMPGENQTVTADMLGPDGNLLIVRALMGPNANATINVVINLDV